MYDPRQDRRAEAVSHDRELPGGVTEIVGTASRYVTCSLFYWVLLVAREMSRRAACYSNYTAHHRQATLNVLLTNNGQICSVHVC